MKPKRAIAASTVLLLLFGAVLPVMADTSISHPIVKVFGNVQKDVYFGRSLFEYKDDEGLSSVLPFERQDKDITISYANIIFKTELENTSIADGTDVASSAFTFTKDYLSSGDLDYIYLKMTNKSALSTDTDYNCYTKLNVEERTVTNDYYMLVTAKVKATGSNIARYHVGVIFKFKDEGANIRLLAVMVKGDGTGDQINAYSNYLGTGYDEVEYMSKGHVDTYYTVQIKIQDLLDAKSKSWKLSKLIGVWYLINLGTGGTLDSSSQVEGWIRHGIVSSGGKIYIDDGTSTGTAINGTTVSFPYSAGDVINVYGANATKIVGVTIPWQAEVTPEIACDADNLRLQYTWEFTMPKSPSGAGDTLTFSNTNITLYGYKDGDAWDKLYVNGVDKLSSIANKKVPTSGTVDYWTYGLVSSLVEGNMYQIVARITYTAEEYDALTEAPLFWSNPLAWLQYKFWSIIIAIAAFLGLGTAWATKQRRRVQVPKR